MNLRITSPWLKNAPFDLSLILLPSVLSVVGVMLFAPFLEGTNTVPLWAWVVFVLGVDVSHVYSTLFRTYFNSHEFRENKVLLTLIPLGVWSIGVALYTMSDLYFWRILAYVAVFHFIRQQYGLLRLYTRQDQSSRKQRLLDGWIIYAATLYPILYWHSHLPRNFHWFMDDDFLMGVPSFVTEAAGWIYCGLGFLYFLSEANRVRKKLPLNLPKNLVILGTALSWYIGIVQFNGDMIFTITNIVSHGLPYMALVWLYGERQKDKPNAPLIARRLSYRLFFSWYSVPLYLGSLLLFGFIEEGLWAGLVWREHLEAFGIFSKLPQMTSRNTLSWLVPLLTLPQVTHYVLDGFIWKIKDSRANWQKVLFAHDSLKVETIGAVKIVLSTPGTPLKK
jgi:hypothetical protein